jgi:hypothetical protein
MSMNTDTGVFKVDSNTPAPTTATSQYMQLKALHQSMLRNGQNNANPIGPADPDEGVEIKDIEVDQSDLLLFKNVSPDDDTYCHSDLIEKSALQSQVLNVFKRIFADVYSVELVFYNAYSKWVFQVTFNYMTDEQFQNECNNMGVKPNEEYFRGLSSTVDTLQNSNSVGQTLLSLTNNQNQSTMDASKYAKFTKQAKKYLSLMIFTNGDNKPRWINGHNYLLKNMVSVGYNGQQFRSIVGVVMFDAEEVLARFCATMKNRSKYRFVLDNPKDKMNGYDTLFTVKMINKKKKRDLQNKYGIKFDN